MTIKSGRAAACVGALRWPEREVIWACGAWSSDESEPNATDAVAEPENERSET